MRVAISSTENIDIRMDRDSEDILIKHKAYINSITQGISKALERIANGEEVSQWPQ